MAQGQGPRDPVEKIFCSFEDRTKILLQIDFQKNNDVYFFNFGDSLKIS